MYISTFQSLKLANHLGS